MRRRGISSIMIAGVLAILSALGLIALIGSGSVFTQIDPTAQQQTVNAIVRARLTQTAEMKATATAEVTAEDIDPIWHTATAVEEMGETDDAIRSLTPVTPGPPPTIDPLLPIYVVTPPPTSTPGNS